MVVVGGYSCGSSGRYSCGSSGEGGTLVVVVGGYSCANSGGYSCGSSGGGYSCASSVIVVLVGVLKNIHFFFHYFQQIYILLIPIFN